MLKVVEKECHFEPDMSRGIVTIESDAAVAAPFQAAFDELQGRDAVALAQRHAAARGCAPAHLNGNILGPYPVNKEGTPLEKVLPLNGVPRLPNDPLMQPARYRIDVPVIRPLS